MNHPSFHLAQANIARMRAPLDSPTMEAFRTSLDRINAIADDSPGFIWRLQSTEGNATSIQAYEDPMVLFNMSVWATMEHLRQFVYRSDHVDFVRRRKEWFEPLKTPILVLWWIPVGHAPTIDEAKARFATLAQSGPGPDAFTFREPFPPPIDATKASRRYDGHISLRDSLDEDASPKSPI